MSHSRRARNTPQFAPIAPIALLEELRAERLLNSYNLFLAHDVMAYEDRYAALAQKLANKSRKFTILDNSVIELGDACRMPNLLEMAEVVQANCIVIPDVLRDMEATLENAHDAFKYQLPEGCDRMFVIQGATIAELELCAYQYLHQCSGRGQTLFLAIPRWIENEFLPTMSARAYLSRQISIMANEAGVGVKMHLLGMSEYIAHDLEAAQTANVMGIDSANPLVMAQVYGLRLDSAHDWTHQSRAGYWDHVHLLDSTIHNISQVRNALIRGEI